MSRWSELAWWLALLLLLPLLVPMALYIRRQALRLAPAAGARRGLAGAGLPGAPLRLLVLGESPVVGVGVSCLQHSLVGYLAQALAEREGRSVTWHVCGENGITAAQACQRLLPQALAEPADLVLLVFGVNDTTGLTSLRRWQAALAAMVEGLRASGARVAFSGVPPLQQFAALPWLLRCVLGWRAALLDARLRRLAAAVGAGYHPMNLAFSADYLALDGYHPSSQGCRVWAQDLARTLSLASTPG